MAIGSIILACLPSGQNENIGQEGFGAERELQFVRPCLVLVLREPRISLSIYVCMPSNTLKIRISFLSHFLASSGPLHYVRLINF